MIAADCVLSKDEVFKTLGDGCVVEGELERTLNLLVGFGFFGLTGAGTRSSDIPIEFQYRVDRMVLGLKASVPGVCDSSGVVGR